MNRTLSGTTRSDPKMVEEYKKVAKIYIKDVIKKIRDVISLKGY